MAGQGESRWDEAAVEALLTVANTRHGPGAHRGRAQAAWTEPHDHLSNGAAAKGFLDGRIPAPGSLPEPDDLSDLRQIRSLVWRLWEAEPDAGWKAELTGLLQRARYQLDAHGGLQPADPGWAGFVASTLPGLIKLRENRERLKRCENPRCGWLFVDRSRNRSRRWCEMATCGNRAKAKRHARRAAH